VNDRDQAFLALRRGTDPDGGDVARSDFARTIISGVLRWRGLLDHFASRLASRPIDRIDPAALDILRIGLYQLRYMHVPDHAAVSETVALAARHASRAKGFVNAVLRSAIRTGLDSLVPDGNDAGSIAIRTSHPEWLVDRWIRRYGQARTIAIATANQELSHADLVVNVAKCSSEEMLARLIARRIEAAASELVPGMIRLRSSSREVAPEVEEGLVYPMDEGSALVALAARGAAEILDLAAAPGGKSIVLAMSGATVVSHDVSLLRLAQLRGASIRMFGNPGRIVVGDGTRPSFGRRFGAVLIDAPCSATGIIRRHPGIRWRLDPATFARYQERQRSLLDEALALSADYCVWATCSLEPEENDVIVRDALARNPEFTLDDVSPAVPPGAARWIDRGTLRITPESGADGFTAIRMRRKRKTA